MKKNAVITGAGSGIGRACALLFAKQGYRVFALGQTQYKIDETVSMAKSGEQVVPIYADIRCPTHLNQALSPVSTVNVLIINAGICDRANTDAVEATDVWHRVVETNLYGSWHSIHTLSSRLCDGAKVVMVSSGLGKLGRAGYTAYAASKHGMLGMMRCLSLEWSDRKICVNAVCPGWVETEMAHSDLNKSAVEYSTSSRDEKTKVASSIPLGRFVQAEEVARLIGWLCSDAAGMITGQACNISGGEFGL